VTIIKRVIFDMLKCHIRILTKISQMEVQIGPRMYILFEVLRP